MRGSAMEQRHLASGLRTDLVRRRDPLGPLKDGLSILPVGKPCVEVSLPLRVLVSLNILFCNGALLILEVKRH